MKYISISSTCKYSNVQSQHICALYPLGCIDTFEQFTNKNAAGAELFAFADTLFECQSACLNKPYFDCPAFEFNPSSKECWIHTSKPAGLNDIDGVITHYSRIQCVSEGWKLFLLN